MIEISRVETYGIEPAIRGLRRSFESWDKSDSWFCRYQDQKRSDLLDATLWSDILDYVEIKEESELPDYFDWKKAAFCNNHFVFIGPNDEDLMKKLAKSGTSHAKFRRMITVTMDITAPLYWWKEFDTYKVGTVALSDSTMHTIAKHSFSINDFSHEHLLKEPDYEEMPNFSEEYVDDMREWYVKEGYRDLNTVPPLDPIEREIIWHYDHGAYYAEGQWDISDYNVGSTAYAEYALDALKTTVRALNEYRDLFLATKDKRYWWQMIQLLPSSYNQSRTVMLNYEVLANIYRDRKDHKLDEWQQFCTTMKDILPWSWLFTLEEPETNDEENS